MRKSFSLFAIGIFIAVSSSAQITISSSDMPNVDDTLRVSIGDSLLLPDVDTTGANFTWDYSWLNPAAQQVDTFLGSTDFPGFYWVVFGPLGNNSTYAVPAPAPDSLGSITLEDVYNFFKESASKFEHTGFGATIGGLPLPIEYDTSDVIYRFPMNYGNMDSSNSGYGIDLTSTLGIYYGQKQKRVNTIDGWGTLKTPFETFPTLRVKSDLFIADTIYIDSLGIGFTIPYQQREYKWLGTNSKIPLLEIDGTVLFGIFTPTNVTYRDSVRDIGEPLSAKENLLSNSDNVILFPNPAGDKIKIHFSSTANQDAVLKIFDLAGRKILEKNFTKENGIHTEEISLKNFPAGMFIVSFENGKNTVYRKLVIAR